MNATLAKFRPELPERIFLRTDGHNNILTQPELLLRVLREEPDGCLVVWTEVDGHNYIDRFPRDELIVPARYNGQETFFVGDQIVERMLSAYDAREERYAAAVHAVPHVPGYYWALSRSPYAGEQDQPVLLDLRDESNVGNGLVAYMHGVDTTFYLTEFYNYDGPLRPDSVWLQRGRFYGQTPPTPTA